MTTPRARHVGTLPNGTKVYRVPFRVQFNDSRQLATIATEEGDILATSAADAANWLRDRLNVPETEIYAWGPAGGEVHRYIGWHSAIGAALLANRDAPRQLAIEL